MQRRLAWPVGRKPCPSTFGRAEKHRRDCRCCAAGSASSNVHRDERRGCESQWTERCGTREQRVGVGLNFAEIFAHATPADHPRPLPVLLSADTNLVGRCVATARPPVATAKFRVDRTTRKPKQHETDDTQATIEPRAYVPTRKTKHCSRVCLCLKFARIHIDRGTRQRPAAPGDRRSAGGGNL